MQNVLPPLLDKTSMSHRSDSISRNTDNSKGFTFSHICMCMYIYLHFSILYCKCLTVETQIRIKGHKQYGCLAGAGNFEAKCTTQSMWESSERRIFPKSPGKAPSLGSPQPMNDHHGRDRGGARKKVHLILKDHKH